MLLPPAVLLAWGLLVAWTGFVAQATSRGEPVRLKARSIATLAREACGRVLLILLSPLGWGNLQAAEAAPTGTVVRYERPVLLVAGHRINRSSLMFLRWFLTKRGWKWVWAVDPGRSGSLADRAEILARRVEEYCRDTDAEQIDIVGFSIGGLVAAWYLRHLGGERRVRRLVTLGCAWRGTRLAVFNRHSIGMEVRYEAPELDDLVPPPVPTVSVWSPHDSVVVPGESALPEGMEGVCLEGAGHVDLLLSPRAFRAVQASLTQPTASGVS